jgi:hypothetical protein
MLGRSRRQAATALTAARAAEARAVELQAERVLLQISLAEGGGPAAIGAAARELAERIDAAGLNEEQIPVLRLVAEALAREGERARADRALELAHARAQQLGMAYEAARVVRLAATLAAEGLCERAGLASRLYEAQRLFRKLRALPELDRAREAQSKLEGTLVGPSRRAVKATQRDASESPPAPEITSPTVPSPLEQTVSWATTVLMRKRAG